MKKITLLSTMLSILILSGCEQPKQKAAESLPKPAKLYEIKAKQSLRTVHLPAVVEAADETLLTFQVAGLIDQIDLQEGQEVKKGQLLVQLDKRSYRNALSSARADYQQAQSEYERAKKLVGKGLIAQSLYEDRLALRNKTKSALDNALKNYEDTSLRAPYDAIIAKLHVERFENIIPHQQILTILSSSGSNVIVQVPASLVIKSGLEMPDKITLELDAAPGLKFPAQLLEAAGKADPATQTFEVRYSFQPPEELIILPGMTGTLMGEFTSTSSKQSNTFLIPLSAVVADSGQTYVWVLNQETMSVSRRDVIVTPNDDNDVVGD